MYKCNMRILERERERGRVGTEFGETVQTRDEMTIWWLRFYCKSQFVILNLNLGIKKNYSVMILWIEH